MMEVNIWSDVRCPFCYIGKRRFEEALNHFEHKDKIRVIWRSFELEPGLKTEPDINALDHLAATKGISRMEAEQMTNHVVQYAEGTDISFDFDKSVVANSFNAHRLIQFSKTRGLGNQAEETLFKAHFTEGKNIDDKEELLQLGISIGLEKNELKDIIFSDAYTDAVLADESKAQNLRIRGVPFFVFNNKYAVSGAQPAEAFLQTLVESYNEFAADQPLIVKGGAACSADGCD